VILKTVPPASKNGAGLMSAQVFNLGYDNFLGRLAVGRIYDGVIHNAETVARQCIDRAGHDGM